jgi:uncharacterized protein (DUF488 family)
VDIFVSQGSPIAYHWLPALGGRRRVSPDSPNTAWRNASFRAYADYMSSTEFAKGLGQLLELASKELTTMMCAEALWWRCHRALIADALCVRNVEVVHILDAKHSAVHPMTSPARIVRHIGYPMKALQAEGKQERVRRAA